MTVFRALFLDLVQIVARMVFAMLYRRPISRQSLAECAAETTSQTHTRIYVVFERVYTQS